jgi:hypothetical protein
MFSTNKVSISSTFYTLFFHQYFGAKKLQSCVLGLKIFGAKILSKKERLNVDEIDTMYVLQLKSLAWHSLCKKMT